MVGKGDSQGLLQTELLHESMILFPTKKLLPLNDGSRLEAGSWDCMNSVFIHFG